MNIVEQLLLVLVGGTIGIVAGIITSILNSKQLVKERQSKKREKAKELFGKLAAQHFFKGNLRVEQLFSEQFDDVRNTIKVADKKGDLDILIGFMEAVNEKQKLENDD